MSPQAPAAHHALVSDDTDHELRLAAQALMRGRPNGAASTVAWRFGPRLDTHLSRQASANLVLLVAHGHETHLQFSNNRAGNAGLLPLAWWQHGLGHVSVFAFACWGARCYASYPLNGHVRRFLGYSEDLWLAASRAGRLPDPVAAFLATVGGLFFAAAEVNEGLRDQIRTAYLDTIDDLNASGRPEDSWTAIRLRQQLDALQLY
jgi:hypothetical protein